MARPPEELTEMRRALGAQLTTYRIAAELTQGQLAKAAFIDRTSVNHIEKGRTPSNHRFWKSPTNGVTPTAPCSPPSTPWKQPSMSTIYDIVNPDKLSRPRIS